MDLALVLRMQLPYAQGIDSGGGGLPDDWCASSHGSPRTPNVLHETVLHPSESPIHWQHVVFVTSRNILYPLYHKDMLVCALVPFALLFIFFSDSLILSVHFMYIKWENNNTRSSDLCFPFRMVILFWTLFLFAIISLPLGCGSPQTCTWTSVQGGPGDQYDFWPWFFTRYCSVLSQGKKPMYEAWAMSLENIQCTGEDKTHRTDYSTNWKSRVLHK